MATVKDYVKGANIDPVTGKSIKTVTTGTSGNAADLTEPIQTSNGSFQAPGFGSLQDQSMDFYPDDPTAAPKSGGAPASNDIQGKGGGSTSSSSKSGTSQQDAVATAKAAGQVTTFGNFLKAAKAGTMLLGMMGIPEAALAQATGQVDYTGDFGNYNQREGWNDAYDAGLKEAAQKGITDQTQANAYAQQYARDTLPDPTTTSPESGSEAINPGVGGANTKAGDPSSGNGAGFTVTPGDDTTDYGGGTKGPTSDGGNKDSGSDDGSGGLGGVSGGSSGGGTKGDFSGGGGGGSGGGSGGKGGDSGDNSGGQAGRAGFSMGGAVIKDNPHGSTVAQDKQGDSMASEATYMMPKSATSFHRPAQAAKPAAKGKDWMQGATQNAHGQFAGKAKAAGMTTQAFAQLHRGSPGMLGEQARLALVLMSKGGGKPKMESGGAVTDQNGPQGGHGNGSPNDRNQQTSPYSHPDLAAGATPATPWTDPNSIAGSAAAVGKAQRDAWLARQKAAPKMATGGAVTQETAVPTGGYEDGGTVIPQAPVGPGANAPRPDGTPAPSGDAGPLPESGDPAGAGAPPGAGASAADGRFDPSASQLADDGVTDNQPINADEGEYVLNKQSVQVLGIGFMNWLDNPQNAAELADVMQAIEGASESSENENGGGAGGGMPPVGGASPPADPTAADASGPDAPADLSAMSMGPGAGAPMPPPGGAGAPPPFMKKKAPASPVAA